MAFYIVSSDGSSVEVLSDILDVIYGPLPPAGRVLTSAAAVVPTISMATMATAFVSGGVTGELVVTLNGVTKTLTVPDGDYSFPDDALANTLNGLLDGAFGAGAVVATGGPTTMTLTFTASGSDDTLAVSGPFLADTLMVTTQLPATVTGVRAGWDALDPTLVVDEFGGVTAAGGQASSGGVAIGAYSTAGTTAMAAGAGANAAGVNSFAGPQSQATGYSSAATGGGTAAHYGTRVHGNASSTADGQDVFSDSLTKHVVALAQISTSNATAKPMSPAAVIPTNRTAWFQAQVIGTDSGKTVVGVWQITGMLVRSSAGATRFAVAPTVTRLGGDSGSTTWTVAAALTADGFAINVTGAAGTSVSWRARTTIMEGS